MEWSKLGKKNHIMLLAALIFFRNYAKIMLLSENYALCHRNYAYILRFYSENKDHQ